jgi:hypothetical protein
MQPIVMAPPVQRLDSPEIVVRSVIIVESAPPAEKTHSRRRRMAARSRSALLWGVATFILSQLALAVAIEDWWPELRDPHHALKEQRLYQRLSASSSPPRTVVMLGSSRTINALRGQQVEQALSGPDGTPIVFNFGIPGAGPLTELLTLRRLLAHGIKPDLLLVEVLPALLAGQSQTAEVTRMDAGRLWHDDLPLVERYLPNAGLRAGWWQSWPIPCHSHRFALLSAVSPGLLPLEQRLDWFQAIDDSGWCAPPNPDHSAARRRFATDRAHGEYSHYLDGFRLGGSSPLALRELLELCRQKSIPVVLVLMPEGSEFRSWYSTSTWEQVESHLTQLRRDFGVEVVNAREWLPDEEFADSHHQFPEGASRFSDRLAREVIGPRLHGHLRAGSVSDGEDRR